MAAQPLYRLRIFVNDSNAKPISIIVPKAQHELINQDYVHHFSIGGNRYEILRKKSDTNYSMIGPEVITILQVKIL